jgi:two-component system nitrate/nitrite response regulator NarL
MAPIRLLIVDDHTLFRQGLHSLLHSEPQFQVVGEATDGAEGVQRAQDLKPDVILMDVQMPNMDGVEATRRLLEVMPQARIMMLTVSENDEHVLASIQCGARGYILKNAGAEELFQAIQKVYMGEAVLSPAVTLQVFQALQTMEPSLPLEVALTPREQEVMRLLALGADNCKIAEMLVISENTVKTHVGHILEKLGVHSRSQVVAHARRLKLIP